MSILVEVVVDGVVQEEMVDTMVAVREVEKRVVAKKEVSMEVLKVAGVMTVEMEAMRVEDVAGVVTVEPEVM